MEHILKRKGLFVVAIIIFCCILLWSGGSLIATASVAFVLLLCIVLPGIFICLNCNLRENILPVAIVAGSIVFLLCYILFLLTGVYAVFYGIPPLLGAMGLFQLFGLKRSVEFHRHWMMLGGVVLLFSLITLPRVALPKFANAPFSTHIGYVDSAQAVQLLYRENFDGNILLNADVFDILNAATSSFLGLELYDTVSFYMPLFWVCAAALSVYNLADSYLKNRHRALLSTAMFFFASSITVTFLDNGFFVTEQLLLFAEYSFNLCLVIAAILTMTDTAKGSPRLRLNMYKPILTSCVYILLCRSEPIYALFLLFAQIVITIVYTATKRFYSRLYLQTLLFALAFALFCKEYVSLLSLTSSFEVAGVFDGLLRTGYTINPVSYYILFPVAAVLSVLLAVFPIIIPTVSDNKKTIKNLKISSMMRLVFLLATTFGLAIAFIFDGAYEPMIALVLLAGAVTTLRAFARKKGVLAISFIVFSIIVGFVNLSVLAYDSTVLQLQNFGYLEQDEQVMEAELLNALYYVRDNTEDTAVLMTDCNSEYEVIIALSQRYFVESQDRVFSGNIREETLRDILAENGVDYILSCGDKENLQGLTVLFESGSFTVFGR